VRLPTGRHHERGQALVEFSLGIIVFLVMLMGLVDLGRGVYMYNGVSQAAREIARVTSVHPGSPLGASTEALGVLATQKSLIPDLGDPTFACVDIDGSSIAGTCQAGQWVRVTIAASYSPVTPLVGLVGPISMQSASSIQIP
jgi:hypothetical protein